MAHHPDRLTGADAAGRRGGRLGALVVVLAVAGAGYLWLTREAPREASFAPQQTSSARVSGDSVAGRADTPIDADQIIGFVPEPRLAERDPAAARSGAAGVAGIAQRGLALDPAIGPETATGPEPLTESPEDTEAPRDPPTAQGPAAADRPTQAAQTADMPPAVEEAARTGPAEMPGDAAPQTDRASQAQAQGGAGDAASGAPLRARVSGEPAVTPARPDAIGEAPSAPVFDVVRIDASGAGIIAGRAASGSDVEILSGTRVIATATADASGEFVAFIDAPASGEGRALTLAALDGQREVESAARLLVLPVDGAAETPVAPAILQSGADGLRLIQPSGLGKVDGVTLDMISYDTEGAVALAGRAPGALPLRIYVDDRALASTAASDAGTWEARIDGLKEGRYVLRVDALRPDGSVESRAESPFQRVYPAALTPEGPAQVTVQPGSNLWVMAQERYGSGLYYTQIFAANREAIRDPDLIYPGQIFALPEAPGITPDR